MVLLDVVSCKIRNCIIGLMIFQAESISKGLRSWSFEKKNEFLNEKSASASLTRRL